MQNMLIFAQNPKCLDIVLCDDMFIMAGQMWHQTVALKWKWHPLPSLKNILNYGVQIDYTINDWNQNPSVWRKVFIYKDI